MGHSFEIILDPLAERQSRIRTLDCVITPKDRFTGETVMRGVTAYIASQRTFAKRSLSGHLFFENLTVPAPISVEIDASKAGYFSPRNRRFLVPQDTSSETERVVNFDLRPERVIDGETATIRGQVRRIGTGLGVAGATVFGSIAGGAPFRTQTDKNGTYALRVGMPPAGMIGGPIQFPVQAQVTVWAELGTATSISQPVDVTDMKTTERHFIDLPPA